MFTIGVARPTTSRKRRLTAGVVMALASLGLPAIGTVPAHAVSPNVVISQVYGGGGNSGALFTHDFVELYNRGATTVSLAGWSVQYASATGTGNFGANANQLTELPSVSLAPGQYLLIQESSTAAVGSPLPAPDVSDATPIAMGSAAGKVALVNTQVSLGCNGGSTPCPLTATAQIVDLVGYGTANFFEGTAAAPALTSTTSALRKADGDQDTDDNAADFLAGVPNPRNTSTGSTPELSLTVNDVTLSEGNSGTTTFTFTVSLSAPAGAGGVQFDIATADQSATGADADYTPTPLAGQSIPEGDSTYAFTVAVNGDTVAEEDETFTVNITDVTGATLADGQGVGTISDDDTVDVCTTAFTPIFDIQGPGLTAALTGNVTTQGVVVGDFEGTAGAAGFYLQDRTGDGDAATSDGIFVFTGSANLVSAGDVVRVTGYARERNGQTTLNGSNSNSSVVPAANIQPCGGGTVAPTDVVLPFESSVSPERYEGMLTRLPQSLTIAEYFNYDRFGEIVLALPLSGETRAFTPTSVEEPGSDALARALANSLSRITLDDAQSAQNPSTLRHPNGDQFSLANRFRGGDLVQNTIGVLGFDFSLYRIVPTGPADYTPVNARPTAPEPVGGTLQVGSFNTLNYFLTLDELTGNPADNTCGALANQECRGADADQPTEFDRQRTKLLAAIIGLDADVLALNEIENTPGVEPLLDIVMGLNAMTGPGTWSWIDTGVIGGDAIRVGIIYQTAAVTPVGDFAILDSSVDPQFIDTLNRPSLAQSFEQVDTGARFTMVANHLKSKGSACAGDADLGDGQGNCNLTREAAAEALVDWVATDPTGSGDPDFLITGDLNSYAMEDPIDAIKSGADGAPGTADDWTNLVAQYEGADAYSYVFDGQAGYLDHALANASLAGQVSGAGTWHINADEPDVLDYDTSFKPASQDALFEANAYRTSDHDPVLVGLDLRSAPVIDSFIVAPSPAMADSTVTATASFTDSDRLNDHTATINWGDGTTSSGVVVESDGSGTMTSTHEYAAAGFFTVTLTVTDGSLEDTATASVIVADPSAGFVTGGGTFLSPAGSLVGTPTWKGKAAFSLSAKYTPGTTIPTGGFSLTLSGVPFAVSGTSIDWLVVTGRSARLAGPATVNGTPGYSFDVAAIDGGKRPDTIRVKVLDAGGTLIYDNGLQSVKGQITLQKTDEEWSALSPAKLPDVRRFRRTHRKPG